jgi:hypothetical protein
VLLGNTLTLEDKVLTILAKKGNVTALELLTLINPTVTKQALYQELRKLIARGAVVKTRRIYSLKLSWLQQLHVLITNAQDKALESVPLPDGLSSKTYKVTFRSLTDALAAWAHFTMALLRRSNVNILLEYAPHAWYHLVSLGAEDQFQKMLTGEGAGYYLIVGDDTPLDRTYARFFGQPKRHISFAYQSFPLNSSQYFSVIGNYLITVKIHAALTKELDSIYSRVKKVSLDDLLEVQRTLQQPRRVEMSVRYSVSEARRYTKAFGDFFGSL